MGIVMSVKEIKLIEHSGNAKLHRVVSAVPQITYDLNGSAVVAIDVFLEDGTKITIPDNPENVAALGLQNIMAQLDQEIQKMNSGSEQDLPASGERPTI